jgi:hypothetical protein
MSNASESWDEVIARKHDKATAVTPAAPTLRVETEASMRARIAAEEAERVGSITSLCALADKPERTAGFVASGKSLSDVLAVLIAEASKPAGGDPATAVVTALRTPRARR